MSTENYKWTTEFDHGNNLMIHKMTDRVSVISNTRTGNIKVFKDGIEINSISNPAISEYGNIVLKIWNDAIKLTELSTE